MRIEHYGFGTITIDGRTYTSDVIMYPDRVDASWWRKEGHYLQKPDLAGIVSARPSVLVVGTGAMGVLEVPRETRDYIESLGIDVRIMKTGDAVDYYNSLPDTSGVVAAFHLTC